MVLPIFVCGEKDMKYLKQFGIIIAISFLGELLRSLIPLPIPASIYGLVLMLLALQTRVIALDKVKYTAKLLIEIMPLMFIPAAVELMESWVVLKDILVPVIIITLVSTVAVMVVSGWATQGMIRREQKKEGQE